RFFERWAVGRLCYFPGRDNSVAEQSGRDGAASAHFSTQGRRCAPMVARWEADCIRCRHAWQNHAHLYRVGGWWSPQRSDQRRTHRVLPQLVAGWRFVVFWQLGGTSWERHLPAEFEDQPTHEVAWF